MIRKWLVIGIILLFVGVTIAPTIAQNTERSQSTSRGNWLYVGGSGPGNFTRIQDAIDNASEGDTVFVYDDFSPYYENVVVNKTINLFGENKNTTIIDGRALGKCVYLNNTNMVNVSGFTIQNAGDGKLPGGIFLQNSKSCIISNNIFKNNNCSGVWLSGIAESNIIRDNFFIENNVGIKSWEASILSISNVITNNVIYNCLYHGILMVSSSKSIITNNLISNSGMSGIHLDGSYGNSIYQNIILNSTDYGIWVEGNNNQIQSNVIRNSIRIGIALSNSDNNFISNNNVDNNKVGIGILGYSTDNSIKNNSINKNTFGIRIYESNPLLSSTNIIQWNNIMNNSCGLFLPLAKGYVILCNNFIMNLRDIRTLMYRNSWDGNYWGRPRILPKPIVYFEHFWIIDPTYYKPGLFFLYPLLAFDWHPAQEPYEIPGLS